VGGRSPSVPSAPVFSEEAGNGDGEDVRDEEREGSTHLRRRLAAGRVVLGGFMYFCSRRKEKK
jgi:hypothetical protein